MNQKLQTILDIVQQNENLTADEKTTLIKAVKKADSDLTISEFKLERTEKVKRTTAILLEETIEELEQKRKAVEAHNRELEIEAALEKVRSRSLAMHKSEELLDAAEILSKELISLSIPHFMSGFALVNESIKKQEVWMGVPGQERGNKFFLPLKGDAVLKKRFESWKNKEPIFYQHVSGKKLANHMEYVSKHFESEQAKETGKSMPDPAIFYCGNFKEGYLQIISQVLLNKEQVFILSRFTKIFQQTYTRFLDLQKAESQAREAQIETALERVRARTMAMHKSEELAETALVLYEQFTELGNIPDRMSIGIFKEESKEIELWPTDQSGSQLNQKFAGSWKKSPVWTKLYKAWKAGNKSFVADLSGQNLKVWLNFIREEIKLYVDDSHMKGRRVQQAAFFSHGMLLFTTNEPVSKEIMQLLIRFAKVFSQTYTRFLDLQKAEAQAKEAQVEGALERVRSKTMAMHNSKDLEDIVISLFDEVLNLGIDKSIRCGIGILEDHEGMETRSVNSNSDGTVELRVGMLNMTIHPMLVGLIKAWKKGSKEYSYEFIGKDVRRYYEALNNEPEYPFNANLETLPEREFQRSFFYSSGILFTFSETPISEGSSKILARFAAVFGQTYQRFLDLQKAEAQVREAQIEAALERVRSRSLAMRQSQELLDVITEMFLQLEVLEIPLDSCFINIYKDEYPKDITMYIAAGGRTYRDAVFVPFIKNPIFTKLLESRKNKESFYSIKMDKKQTVRWWKQFFSNASNIEVPRKRKNYIAKSPGLATSVSVGKYASFHVMRYVPTPYSYEENQIFVRFGNVFDQVYTRFLDLQKAEAREKEAIKQSSLDRVRAEIASMRTTDDLDRITPLIWSELTSLGVPFFRCGIFIIREEEKMVHTYLSTPSGKSLGALHIGFHEKEVELIQQIITNWRKQEVYSEEWDQEQFVENMGSFMKRGHIKSPEKYQAGNTPPENLVLQFVPFKQGMLYAGNSEPLIPDHIELMKDLAKAFSVAYSRYEDFNELEKAKSKVEVALTDLKSTQNQLVQSEKMASLGELTAGIAHEIQNPLNFVNNFSEVSKELIEEMMEEMEKGDVEEVKALADDIIQNLEKIHHHGRRADGIVKGMLQHSRTSSGEKELTDINALADEYLRLAYHGLRAKDKSFNATMETDFDESIDKVNIIPQDIGRVILNLITNAFYVVSERKKLNQKDYEPTVTVTTKKESDTIFVSVKDNGNGIPQKVLDKIFQPFFTTKPTGQGTGLGLSLSYDIVKVHGGELKVKTKEGEGTDFVISLSVNTNSK